MKLQAHGGKNGSFGQFQFTTYLKIRMRIPLIYRFLDTTSGIILFSLTLFLGWAFGINGLSWALWTVRLSGWLLGSLLLGKWLYCRATGYQPPTHGTVGMDWPTKVLGGMTALILLWVLISWTNARADAHFSSNDWRFPFTTFNYIEDYIPWLPHTYDLTSTRGAFWTYTALAALFWSARDWFRGKSRVERHSEGDVNPLKLPQRVSVWLWTIIISALVMAVTGIIQKLDGTRELLWILPWGKPTVPELPFGPYMYRANAAQYFNLIWPVALGFWWHLRQAAALSNPHQPLGQDASIVLLPISAVLAACPAITLSRGGTIMSVLLLLASLLGGTFVPKALRRGPRLAIVVISTLSALIAIVVAGRELIGRFQRNDYESLNGRTQIYTIAKQMLSDFSWLGAGPETIPAIYFLYRRTADDTETLEAYLHNDWLETMVTFGYLGTIPILIGLAMIPLTWWTGKGHPTSGVFCFHVILGLVGMLVHGTIDFPFQITALLGTWLLFAALLTVIAPPNRQVQP